MKYVCLFTDSCATDLALVGGKGSNLGRMIQAGFPVPPGFCVTSDAYRYLAEVTGLSPVISRKIERINFQDPEMIARTAACIRELINQQPIPVEIAADIESGYRLLDKQMSGKAACMLPVAIRSSATAEDLPEASFAGQQDTYLNVRGQSSVLEHVRRCWASLWTARAMTYRHRHGFDQQQVLLAVVIQTMIDPETSGILFTANPINGRRDECVINASWGLGEAIVSGVVTPDTYVVNKLNGRISQKQIARKERMIRSNPKGGAIEGEIAAHRRDISCLSDRQVADLTALATRIEDHYGQPQDIEWAYRNGRWTILQSRPITTLSAMPSTTAVSGRFSRAMFVEIFPEAISPAFLSVVSPLLAGMLDFTFQQLGIKVPKNGPGVRAFYCQPYFDVDYIEEAFADMPISDREQLVAQFTNPFARSETRGHVSGAQVKLLVRMLLYLRHFRRQMPDLLVSFRSDVEVLNQLEIDSAEDKEIVEGIRRLVFEGASQLLNGDFLLIALVGTLNRLLLRILLRSYGEKTGDIFNGLITGVTGNVIMETNELLWNLAQEAIRNPDVEETVLGTDPQEALLILQQTANGRTFLAKLQSILAICGHREMHLDILYPTWGEDPAPVLAFVRSYLASGTQEGPSDGQKRLVEQREALTEAVLAKLSKSLLGSFFFAPLTRLLLSQIHILLRERDTMHYEWTRLFPPARKLLLELGHRWTERRLIDGPDDIFFLQLEEMDQLTREPHPVHDTTARRRAELAKNLHGPWPERIENGQEIFRKGVNNVNGQLTGVAGSPGMVSGRCRIIRSIEEFGRLERGDILVAPLTNPVWTPLFAIAAGVVTDVGGILSHGAIVAREYGIPAVLSVNGASKQLIDGQMITVDGDKGVVVVIQPEDNVDNKLDQRCKVAQETAQG